LDSPELIDHLVTFNACQILTGGGLTEILGTHPARFRAANVSRPGPEPPNAALPHPCWFRLRRSVSRLTWTDQPERQVATMTIEKCINEFDVDEVIFEEGSTGRELFVVLEGQVEIAKMNGASKTVIVTLGKGEFFGEMAVIDGSSRSATAIAAAPNTRVMRINHARFVYLVSQQPAFALMIMDALSKRLRASNTVAFRAAAPS
jgi:CRP/FNR family transcriptional regulator, cyclic AMP receptor protein